MYWGQRLQKWFWITVFFHMKKALKKILTRWFRTKSEKQKNFSDVDALQLSQDPDIFQHASTLFLKKYEAQLDF